MAIEQRLLQKKKRIGRQWFDMLAGTYPLETVRLLKKETNQFANPVGHSFLVAIDEILDEFLGQNSAEAMGPLLDKVIRIRAIQDFSPSSSLAFIFSLKTIALKVLEEDLAAGVVDREELSDFDRKVDALALSAFDVYMRCRENLFEVRMTEVKNRTHRLLKLAEIISEPGAGGE
ncbi:MAG: RsbRD N-terminal domain-containing protein [Syntrophobacteraceae bacterium]